MDIVLPTLRSARVGSEGHCETTKSLKICTLIVSTLRSCCLTCVQCAVAHCLELLPHVCQCLKASSQVLCAFNFSAEIL